MGKTKAGKGKIVARIFLVIGILLSMTAGSGLAYVKHTGDRMLGLMNYDKSNKVSGMDLSKYALDSDTEIVNILLVKLVADFFVSFKERSIYVGVKACPSPIVTIANKAVTMPLT